MTRLIRAIVTASVLIAPATAAFAHTALKGSNPASGSVLAQSPLVLTLTFLEPARLTYLALVTPAGERRLQFVPGGSALTFSSPKPGLTQGRNEIRWRALSRDGHVVEGSIIVVLRPPMR
jgi:methionine-rich copper-binding protein CopC